MRVVVYDTGCGIPQERQKVIFEEFHRLDSSRQPDDTGGLGLGLSIVRRLAHALKVPVVVCSKPGRGSLFAIDLPLVNLAPRTITMERPEVSLAGRTVLVVDDDQRILDAVTFILKEVGCEVLPARSLKESLRVSFAAACVPDAIVCDFQLGGELNGGDVITALREEFNADIPALLVTGETEGREASRMAQALGVRLHHKPLVPVEFKRALNVALGEEGPTHG